MRDVGLTLLLLLRVVMLALSRLRPLSRRLYVPILIPICGKEAVGNRTDGATLRHPCVI